MTNIQGGGKVNAWTVQFIGTVTEPCYFRGVILSEKTLKIFSGEEDIPVLFKGSIQYKNGYTSFGIFDDEGNPFGFLMIYDIDGSVTFTQWNESRT